MSQDMNKLNILMVTTRYFPFMGGIETHVHEVGRRMVRNGLHVTLLSTVPYNKKEFFPKEEEVEGMHVIRVPAWPSKHDYGIAPEIFSIINQGNWDIIHCQGCHTFVPPAVMAAAKRAHIPYVVTFHTGGHSSGFRNRIRGAQWQLLRPLLANASKLIGVSDFEAEYFRNTLHLPAQQFTVIPNGIALPNTLQPIEGLSDQTLIASVGRLERYKGHQRMITALPIIRQKYPNAQLLILGSGPYEGTLKELARKTGVVDHVEIRSVPAGDRDAMTQTLSSAALVTLLSEYEAHPIAIMEALALRRPILVTDTSGLREIATRGLARSVSLNSAPEEIARVALQQIENPLVPPVDIQLPTWDECTQRLQKVYYTSTKEISCVS